MTGNHSYYNVTPDLPTDFVFMLQYGAACEQPVAAIRGEAPEGDEGKRSDGLLKHVIKLSTLTSWGFRRREAILVPRNSLE